MDDAKRFLRHILPGLAFFLQGVFISLLYFNFDLQKISDFLNAGVGIGILLTSGIIGFLFSMIYYWWHWKFFMKSGCLDYKEILSREIKAKPINKKKTNSIKFLQNLSLESMTQEEAYSAINVYWKIFYPLRYKELDKQTGYLFNMTNSIGTTMATLFVSWFFGLIILLTNCNTYPHHCNHWWNSFPMWYNLSMKIFAFTLINFIIICFMYSNYKILTRILHGFILKAFEAVRGFEEDKDLK